jgi:hypothetical protein
MLTPEARTWLKTVAREADTHHALVTDRLGKNWWAGRAQCARDLLSWAAGTPSAPAPDHAATALASRSWLLPVTGKRELFPGGAGSYELVLGVPREYELHRPPWTERTHAGGPLALMVAPDEYEAAVIGSVVRVSVEVLADS